MKSLIAIVSLIAFASCRSAAQKPQELPKPKLGYDSVVFTQDGVGNIRQMFYSENGWMYQYEIRDGNASCIRIASEYELVGND